MAVQANIAAVQCFCSSNAGNTGQTHPTIHIAFVHPRCCIYINGQKSWYRDWFFQLKSYKNIMMIKHTQNQSKLLRRKQRKGYKERERRKRKGRESLQKIKRWGQTTLHPVRQRPHVLKQWANKTPLSYFWIPVQNMVPDPFLIHNWAHKMILGLLPCF